jgi:hypothetical protein
MTTTQTQYTSHDRQFFRGYSRPKPRYSSTTHVLLSRYLSHHVTHPNLSLHEAVMIKQLVSIQTFCPCPYRYLTEPLSFFFFLSFFSSSLIPTTNLLLQYAGSRRSSPSISFFLSFPFSLVYSTCRAVPFLVLLPRLCQGHTSAYLQNSSKLSPIDGSSFNSIIHLFHWRIYA